MLCSGLEVVNCYRENGKNPRRIRSHHVQGIKTDGTAKRRAK
jgi:hypothetical protein